MLEFLFREWLKGYLILLKNIELIGFALRTLYIY